MRKTMLVACLFLLPVFAGCAVSDALFAVFGDNYTGGGHTRADKETHFNRQMETSRNYTADAPTSHWRPWDEP